MPKPTKSLTVNCPTCDSPVAWEETAKYRPFCSERCQQIDLGAWSTESYRIPSEPTEEWSETSMQDEDAQSQTLQ